MRIRFDAQAVFEVGCLNWSNIMVDWGARRSVDPGVLRFSYVCHACNRCCRNKAIRVSPYEILRLARHVGISTTQFIESYTEAGGTVLPSKENGDCCFLGERGYSVHPDRPLACRLYPLAR
jgi:Fe-S-cluster containining protein